MPPSPHVSIICLSREGTAEAGATLESLLLQQTRFQMEVLFVEAPSSHGMSDAMETFRKRFPGTVFIPSPVEKPSDGSRYVALNRVIGRARGKYIALCHAGDRWTDPLKLQKQVDFLERNAEYSYTCHAFTRDEVSDEMTGDGSFFPTDADLDGLPTGPGALPVHVSTLCFRNLCGKLPHEARHVPDIALLWCAMMGNFGKGRFLAGISANMHLSFPQQEDQNSEAMGHSLVLLRSAFWIFQYLDRVGKHKQAGAWLATADATLQELTAGKDPLTVPHALQDIPVALSDGALHIDLSAINTDRRRYEQQLAANMPLDTSAASSGMLPDGAIPALFKGVCRNQLLHAELLLEMPAASLPVAYAGPVVHTAGAFGDMRSEGSEGPRQVVAYLSRLDADVLSAVSDADDHFPDTRVLLSLDHCSIERDGGMLAEFHGMLASRGYGIYQAEEPGGVLKPLRDIGIFTRQHQGVPEFPLRLLAVRKDPGMHIVYFAHDWLLSGASMCLLDLVRGLAGRGAVINVVVPGEGNLKETLQQNGIGTHVIDRRLVMELAWNWTIPGCGSDDLSTGIRNGIHLAVNSLVPMLREWQPDMILSQTVTLPWGAVCARILGIPFACSMREYGDLDHGLQFPLGMRACMEALYKDSDMAFCITRDVARHLFGEDPDKKVEVIYINLHMDGIDRLVDVPVANGLKLADNEVPRIGLLATYKEQKGHEDLVRAAIALMEEGLVFRCVMAGWIADGDYYLRLREMADASGHGSNFEFLTHTESPYLLLDELDLVISCSQIEGLGRTLIEAIQLGKPIIYADTGGPAEIYTHGEHGLSYRHGNWKELAERIKDTLQDKDAAQRRVSAARLLIAARLNEDQYAGKVWALIRKAAAVDVSRKPAATLQLMADAFRLEIAPEQMRPRLFYSSIPNDFHDVQSLHAGPIPFGPFDLDFTFSGDGIEYFSLLITNRHPIELVIHRFLTDADGPEADGTEPVDCWSNGDPVGQFSWKYLRTDPALVFRMPMAIGRLRLIGHVRLLSRADVLYELGQQVEALRQDNLELRSDHQREVSAWEAGMAEKTRTIVHMEEVVAEKTRIIVHMEEVLSQKSLAIENWEATHARDARRIGELEWHLQKREQELEKTKWRLDDITGTYAWKFSAPLRRLEKFILRTFGKSGRRK